VRKYSDPQLGLIFISIAVLFWGILPTALKLSTAFIDAVSLTWFRFLIALLVTFVVQWHYGRLKPFLLLKPKDWLRLIVAGVLLMFNYVSFVFSLDYLAPGAAQLNFQTAPFVLAFGGVLFFKETLSKIQLMCFVLLAFGMLLFFHPQLAQLLYQPKVNSSSLQVGIGVLIVQFSVLSWTSYALLQKSLIKRLSPSNILLFIYGFGILAMAPLCDFNQFVLMDISDWGVALFCAFNTLVAYGCFGQSMQYWSTAQVSAMLALTPVLSFSSTALVVSFGWWPEVIEADNIDMLSLIGIVIIVCCVFIVQLWPQYQRTRHVRNKCEA
jgi:drug/metabolite transporter (DMT)-like permease